MFRAFPWKNEEIRRGSFLESDGVSWVISVKIGGWLVLVMGELNEWAGRQYFGVVMATMTSKAGMICVIVIPS
jgi:hypothetical protein